MFPVPRLRRRRPRHPDDYPPASLRLRVAVAVAAVVVTVVVGLALLTPQLRLLRAKAAPPPDRPACAGAEDRDCVGGTMAVRNVPAPGPAGAGSAAAASPR